MIFEIDNGRRRWRDLSREQKRAIVGHWLESLRNDHPTLTFAEFRRCVPSWSPRDPRYVTALFDGCHDWRTLVERYGIGVDPKYRHRKHYTRGLCECGAIATNRAPVRFGTPTGQLVDDALDLCDDCLRAHLALERKS